MNQCGVSYEIMGCVVIHNGRMERYFGVKSAQICTSASLLFSCDLEQGLCYPVCEMELLSVPTSQDCQNGHV